MQSSDIAAMVDLTIKETFGDVAAETVGVEPDIDSDGDAILRVTITFDPGVTLQAKRMAGFVRHLRSRLAEHDIADFPIVSYVSRSDLSKRKFAAH